MVTVKINGKEVTVEDGTLILDAARDAGYEIPTFCYQADLMGIGSCRMCLVEIEGQKKLQPSCITPVLHGMSIHTETPTVMSARSSVLEFLLANHALDCPVCDKGGECELQDAVYKYGPHKGRHAEAKFKFQEKDYRLSHVIIKNSNRCVQCMKCVRVCREVVGANVLGSLGRGDHQEETSFFRSFIDCDNDGNCIEVCPVGCFMRAPFRYKTRPWDLKGADTVCPYCATGCRMVIEHRDGVVVRSRAQIGVGLNSETLCARGRFGYGVINNKDRLTSPLVRRDGRAEASSWEDALGMIKENLRSVPGRRIGGVVSARLTNEEVYLFQKVMRRLLMSPNIDSSSRWDPAAVEAFVDATGMHEGGVSIFDCMESDTALIIGTHLTEENPVAEYIVRRISANRRMNVIIASPRAMRLDSSANVTIRHLPAAERAVFDALTAGIYAENAGKLDSVEGIGALKGAGLKDLSIVAGANGEEIGAAVKRLGFSKSVSIFAGTDFLRFPDGIAGLKLFKGVLKALDKKVTVLPILDRCNQRGAWEMGAHPGFGPGYSAVDERGLGFTEMLTAAANGEIDCLYLAGVDPVTMHPDGHFVKSALSKVRFLIVQDAFMTETAELAHVVLPAAVSGEKDGTFTNQEGRAQSIKRLLAPPGKAKRDLEIIAAVGGIFDSSYALCGHASVFDEIRKETGMYRDVSLAFNNKRNIDNRLDNKGALVKGAKAFSPASVRLTPKASSQKDEEYPFLLITGNSLFHSGGFSRRSEILCELLKGPVVEISEQDAVSLGLADGCRVKVKGRDHQAELTLKTRKGSKRGVAFIAENFEDVPVNRFFQRGEWISRVKITGV